jgi:hypothetical protein
MLPAAAARLTGRLLPRLHVFWQLPLLHVHWMLQKRVCVLFVGLLDVPMTCAAAFTRSSGRTTSYAVGSDAACGKHCRWLQQLLIHLVIKVLTQV